MAKTFTVVTKKSPRPRSWQAGVAPATVGVGLARLPVERGYRARKDDNIYFYDFSKIYIPSKILQIYNDASI
jgi:hypothetical protein